MALYAWTPESARTLLAMVRSRRRVGQEGIPRVEGVTPREIAASVLRANAGPVLSAGGGHFRAMWTADTGKAFRGALQVLPREYLEGLVARMLRESARAGHVPTCFTARGWHDVPWRRGDNGPWLLHAAAELGKPFLAEHEAAMRQVYARWAEKHLDPGTGLVRTRVQGDWMDTVPRPSSTYNNLCALHAHALAEGWGFPDAAARRAQAEKALLEDRWETAYLKEHVGADATLCADANVPALYFGLLSEAVRRRIAGSLEESPLVEPVAMRARVQPPPARSLPLLSRLAPTYHATIWPHLGLMHAVGLQRLGLPWRHRAAPIENGVRLHGTFIETLDGHGEPYVDRFLATEHRFTMAAGLYLELTGKGWSEDESSGALR